MNIMQYGRHTSTNTSININVSIRIHLHWLSDELLNLSLLLMILSGTYEQYLSDTCKSIVIGFAP